MIEKLVVAEIEIVDGKKYILCGSDERHHFLRVPFPGNEELGKQIEELIKDPQMVVFVDVERPVEGTDDKIVGFSSACRLKRIL